MARLANDMDSTELDKLIHNFEFENKLCVKMIERKNEVISSLSSQIEQQLQKRKRLEEEISRFDEDTKHLHRNYTNNRDNIVCLKNTISVMTDHMDALSKQLSAQKTITNEDSKSFSEHLENYTRTRDEYMAKYESLPLALDLKEAQAEMTVLQEKVNEIGERKKKFQLEISALEEELGTKVMTRIISKIVQCKSDTQRLESDIHECVTKKTTLLEQLKELQKSKEQDKQDSVTQGAESQSLEQPCRMVDDVSEENGQTGICERTNQFASMCLEETLNDQTFENTNRLQFEENAQQPPETNFRQEGVGVDEDVPILENGQSSEPVPNQPDPPEQACSNFEIAGLCAGPLLQKSLDQSDQRQTRHGQAPQSISPAESCSSVSGSKYFSGKTTSMTSANGNPSLPQPSFSFQQRMPGLARPRLQLSVPRLPQLSRPPRALRVPTLTVPPPLRVQQPRFESLVLKKMSAASTMKPATDAPQMKEPNPPPPKPSASIGFAASKEKPSVPMKGLSLPSTSRGHLPPTSSAGFPLRQPQQLFKKIDDNSIGKSHLAIRGPTVPSVTVPSVQNRPPLPEPYAAPLNYVLSEPMIVEEEQSNQEKTGPYQGKDHTEMEQQDYEITSNKSSTPKEKRDVSASQFKVAASEPLFKLDHSFGSQNSLRSSISQSQEEEGFSASTSQTAGSKSKTPPELGAKTSLLAQLESVAQHAAGQAGSSPDPATKRQSGQKSFFSLFNISQKSDPFDAAEDGEQMGSIFNFGNFAVDKGNNEDTDEEASGWMAPTDLLGMMATESCPDKSQNLDKSDAFPINFGSSKNEGGDQTSFFSFGGGDFSNDETSSRPIFNLF